MKNPLMSPLKLGITGGIGSGKTTVCKVFSVLGIPVFSADTEAKNIMNSDSYIINKINSLAGKDLYKDGNLDRPELARLIFNNKNLLDDVNLLVHPVVFENFREWAKIQSGPYSVMEAAILFESGAAELVDKIITVVTPTDERIVRLISGKKLSEEQVMERIKNQLDDDSRIRRSDYIIYNSENDMIIPAILKIHEELVKLSKNRT